MATGCGTQHPLRALGGTRVLLAAAPTTPPCFRHWRRSSSLLRIDSGIIIFIFDERENLRIFPFIFFTRGVVTENGRCSVAAMATFCLLSACKDAPLGQRQGGVFRLPPPYLWTPPTPQCNNCDRRQRRKQGGVVGAAASKTRVPPKARRGCWVPQPDKRRAFPIIFRAQKARRALRTAGFGLQFTLPWSRALPQPWLPALQRERRASPRASGDWGRPSAGTG